MKGLTNKLSLLRSLEEPRSFRDSSHDGQLFYVTFLGGNIFSRSKQMPPAKNS